MKYFILFIIILLLYVLFRYIYILFTNIDYIVPNIEIKNSKKIGSRGVFATKD